MAWVDLHRGILEEFAAAQHLVERRTSTEEGGLEALRQAYRERHAARGLCRSCKRPVLEGRRQCAEHRRQGIERAKRWYRANRAEAIERMRERRRAAQTTNGGA